MIRLWEGLFKILIFYFSLSGSVVEVSRGGGQEAILCLYRYIGRKKRKRKSKEDVKYGVDLFYVIKS